MADKKAKSLETKTVLLEKPAWYGDVEWQKEYLCRSRISQARIPPRYTQKTFDTFKTGRSSARKGVLQAARAYVSSFKLEGEGQGRQSANSLNSLILQGGVGCGKTHVAVAILKAIIEKGYRGLYYNMVDLFSEIRETYSDSNDATERNLIEELLAPDLLVLDDLGAETTAKWVNDRLYLIINRRYESCKPLVVTTNLGLDELAGKLGERIVSRLCEISEFFDGFPKEDYRRAHMR